MKQEQPKDKSLDIPSVANEEKHINFLKDQRNNISDDASRQSQDEQDKKRRKEWKDGIEAGKHRIEQPSSQPGKNRIEEPSFQKRDLNEQEEY